jgi:hypothetical protein
VREEGRSARAVREEGRSARAGAGARVWHTQRRGGNGMDGHIMEVKRR